MARRRQGVVKNATGLSDSGSMISTKVLSQSGRDMSGCCDETSEDDTSSRRVHRICARSCQSKDRFLDCGPDFPSFDTGVWFVQVAVDEKRKKNGFLWSFHSSSATKSSSRRP
ncbi:hypothetical protein Taro_039252 [Colocasia esculenta]|uniref:Uncharacterized protein n=1 Tax=Colocasia esculenta TaxID=4460 RepID=A0A843WV61_COLES|nr:hypothetical protein [Colocasia esculenta]